MSTQTTTRFPFAGSTFEVDYGDLVATNAYSTDENSLIYEITGGSLKGATATVAFEWKELDGGNFVISWQEADGSTVVHVDNFEKGFSLSFFTTPKSDFYRLSGTLRAFADLK
ncbi:MoaF-related domain-containing protein [Rhizobium mesoamericanum]|uniref:MoaF-like domain-containing protein n=1 Tax=Rhizobium mesoamericanum STM3625 TaxID=1211777 RepID=K0PQZ9_9HYPH|nr:hypothetical protein [Rhizobium mesoamericanum]CCM79061.1 conserved hypothetical protein [Rhizobium mesoamericanum STM3625]